MAVRVEENLERMRRGLSTGADHLGLEAAVADGDIDGFNVSLTGRCYEILVREAPMASDLRLVVSVVRVLNELERISDHAVAVCEGAPGVVGSASGTAIHDLLVTMCDDVVERFRTARRGWGAMDIGLAEELAGGSALTEALHARLVRELLALDGADAVPVALAAAGVARSLERICDHTTVIGARLRYLITGDPNHLAAEVR